MTHAGSVSFNLCEVLSGHGAVSTVTCAMALKGPRFGEGGGMTLLRITLPQDLLSRDEEVELFAWIEAGIYAAQLLQHGSRHHCPSELEHVRDVGLRAIERVWSCNLRLAAKVAQASARRYQLPVDDLFQEASLAIMDAIMRFDISRGHKFSTLAHTYVTRRVLQSAHFRAGAAEGTSNRAKRLARIRASFALEARESMPSFQQVATAAGMSVETAMRATSTMVALEEATQRQTSQDGHYDAIETHGTDYLDLLGRDGELLRLRYGIGTRSHSRREVATLLKLSVTTVARFEQKALERARALLEGDRCRLPRLTG